MATNPVYFNSSNGHYYQVVDANLSWTGAQNAALSKTYSNFSGYLVEIGSAEENSFVANLLGNKYGWIGATDYSNEGQWKWAKSGDPVNYSNWYLPDGQPDNFQDADYAVLYGSSYPDYPLGRLDLRGSWDDGGQQGTQLIPAYVVEYSSATQISVSVANASVSENAASNLVYTFTRTGDTSSPLSVNFAVSGTANSADYTSSVTLFSEPTKSWTNLLGTSSGDVVNALTTGLDGAIYVSGYTGGDLDGQTNSGNGDAFIIKYLADGTKIWTKLLGTSLYDQASALTTGIDGAIYVGGHTGGNLDGRVNSGDSDAFITKYLSDGTKSWTKLLGTASNEWVYALTTGIEGSIYVSGYTGGSLDGQTSSGNGDAFITKYLPDGTKSWTKLLGSSSYEEARALTTGLDGSIYVSGVTGGNLDGQTNSGGGDAFITKYLPDGTKSWTKLLGTSAYDSATALATGLDGAIYVSGYTYPIFDGQTYSGSADAFIAKYLPDGTKSWTKLLVGNSDDYANALTTGIDGSIYISGFTFGNLEDQISSGSSDAFITKYLPDETKSWTKLLVGNSDDYANALTTGIDGSIYVSGFTLGNLEDQISSGSYDAFIAKYQVTPQITFAAGSATATLTIDPTADAIIESAETVVVTLAQGAGYELDTSSVATVMITDSPTYSISSSSQSVNEGSSVIFTVATTNIANGTVLNYSLGGTGISAADIVGAALTGAATVNNNQASFTVNLANDLTTEGLEILTATLEGRSASVTVNDSSATVPSVSFATTTSAANEGHSGNQAVNVTANLSSATTAAVTVPITYSGTATSGTDYSAATTSITIAAGATSGTASISVVGDSTVESNETVVLTMGTPTGATLGANTSYTHTITNDDVMIGLTATNSSVAEDGSSNIIYTFTRTGDTSSPLSVNFAVSGTANSADYTSSVNLFSPPTKSWTNLLGTSEYDHAFAIATGLDGAIYVSGVTYGSFDGQTYFSGGGDAFITKYLPDGTKSWTNLLGSGSNDSARGLTTDLDGAIYVSGVTNGSFDGQTYSGGGDAFITKYLPDGTKSWTNLLGSRSEDSAMSLTTGLDGSIYVSGWTLGNLDGQTNSGSGDAFIAKYLPDGTKSWTNLLGTSAYDSAMGLTTGLDGAIYVSGFTFGGLDGQTNSGGYDAFITKYLSDGTKSWTNLLGSPSEEAAISLTTGLDGSIYVSGYTAGSLDAQINSGGYDAFITKYLSDGTKSWTNLLGTSAWDQANALTTGLDGSIYVSGYTEGSLDGQINSGGMDAYITKYLPDGTKSWTNLFGLSPYDEAHALTTGLDGSIYVSGGALVSLDGQTYGGLSDAFITKFQVTPQITFAAGSATATLTIEPTADTDAEGDETVVVSLTQGNGYEWGGGSSNWNDH